MPPLQVSDTLQFVAGLAEGLLPKDHDKLKCVGHLFCPRFDPGPGLELANAFNVIHRRPARPVFKSQIATPVNKRMRTFHCDLSHRMN